MTRRSLLLSAVARTLARGSSASKLESMAQRQCLAIVGDRLSATVSNVPEALTASGQDIGPLAMVDHPYNLSFSPDGCWISWLPLNHEPWRILTEFEVLYASSPRSVRRIKFRGDHGMQTAISSNAGRLALAAKADGAPFRTLLQVVNPATTEVVADLSDTARRFENTSIERLRMSGDGGLLAVGAPGFFVVVDVSSAKVVHEGPGRYPSLCPSGSVLTFVRSGELVAITLASGSSRNLTGRWHTAHGAGAWSPDGTFFLAGLRPFLGFLTHLAAVEFATGEIADMMRLDEGDSGGDWAWIRRSLLSVQA